MAINLSDNILSKTTAPADAKYGPYIGTSISNALIAANAYLLPSYRYKGLTVGIVVNSDPIAEYWFKDGILLLTPPEIVPRISAIRTSKQRSYLSS